MKTCIGLLSDTHGTLDERALTIFKQAQVGAIIHAGDIGPASILHELEAIAPVVAVLGNNDVNMLGYDLNSIELRTFNGVRVQVVHNFKDTTFDGTKDVIVCGHSHRPVNVVEPRSGILVVNPGSVTRPRGIPAGPSVALLDVANPQKPVAQIVYLEEFDAAISCGGGAKGAN